MKKSELKELYQMMFPDYPDIVTVKQLREMLGVSRAACVQADHRWRSTGGEDRDIIKNPESQRD